MPDAARRRDRRSRGAAGGGLKNTNRSPENPEQCAYMERQNLTMRMSMRRFTRLTDAFSKKVENHAAAVTL